MNELWSWIGMDKMSVMSNQRAHTAMPNEKTHTAGDAMMRAHELVRPQMTVVEAKLRHLPDIQPQALREAVQRIVASGGKRIRPVISLLIAGMLGQRDNPRAIDLAS